MTVLEPALMIAIVVLSVAVLLVLLVVVPTWIVIRDVRSGRPDPGVE
jgi:hypothetical protein